MVPSYKKDLALFHRKAFFFDMHMHSKELFPRCFQNLNASYPNRIWLPFTSLRCVHPAGVNGGILCSVGDHPFLLLQRKRDKRSRLVSSCVTLKTAVRECQGKIVTTADQLMSAFSENKLGIVLGVEGFDPFFSNIDDIEALYAVGIRFITPVHLCHNLIGTASADFIQYWQKYPIHDKRIRGLTALGEAAVRKMNSLGIVIDLAHADTQTFADILTVTQHPVIVSHTGARSCGCFHRYLSDGQIRAIGRNGGVIGVWPFYYWGQGMRNAADFKCHIRHIIALAGEDHLAIGTDFNGVPGYMDGYNGPRDSIYLSELLFEAGLDDRQVRKVIGFNFLRVFARVCGK